MKIFDILFKSKLKMTAYIYTYSNQNHSPIDNFLALLEHQEMLDLLS